MHDTDEALSVLTSLKQVNTYDGELTHRHTCHPIHLDLIGCFYISVGITESAKCKYIFSHLSW